MKKFITIIIILVILGVAYWLISPFWRNVMLDEALPGAIDSTESNEEILTPVIEDNLESMSPETRAEFDKQVAEMQDEVLEVGEAMPEAPQTPQGPVIVSRANLVPRSHDVEGEALIVQSGEDYFLRFENLDTVNGPDLRIYLSADLSSNDIVDLGPIRATQGNVNYEIPAGTDLSRYKNAMIWCRAFGVLFSYAEFK